MPHAMVNQLNNWEEEGHEVSWYLGRKPQRGGLVDYLYLHICVTNIYIYCYFGGKLKSDSKYQ